MGINEILTAIATVGFPIVACCAMAFFFSRVNDNYRNDIKEINAQHKAEMDAMTQAINNNTMVIQRLVDRMDGENN
ncbi:MAG: hypothetical protein J6Q89_07975 [Clostridia bacterium]|nr:hypothetical protein [Clostridia bacterium]